MRVVPRARRVGRTVALATRLDPDECINKRVASACRGAHAESGTLDIAPVTPSLLLRWLNAIATRVGDEVGGEAVRSEQWCQRMDVQLLVVVRITGGVRRRGGDGEGVVVGDVGREATDSRGAASSFVDLSEQVGCRL